MPHKATPETPRPTPTLTSAWLSRTRRRVAKLRSRFEACDPSALTDPTEDHRWNRVGRVLDLAERVTAALGPVLRSGDLQPLQATSADLWQMAEKIRGVIPTRQAPDLTPELVPSALVPSALVRLDALLTFVRKVVEMSERASRLLADDAEATRQYLAFVTRWNDGLDELGGGLKEAEEWGACPEALQVYEAYLTLLCRYEGPDGQDLAAALGAEDPEAVATLALEQRVAAMFADLMQRIQDTRGELGLLAD